MDEPINSDGELEDVMRDLLNAGLVTIEPNEDSDESE
jgi:hypothetical protein